MDLIVLIELTAGLACLVAGAELLVRGSSRLARAFGLSPLIIGLTVVAYSTAGPELAVSLQALWSSQPDLVLGNIIGSNLFNVLCILGLASFITPLVVAQQVIRLDVPIMIGVSFLVLLLGLDGEMSRLDGLVLLGSGIAYTLLLLTQGGQEPDESVQEEYNHQYGFLKTLSVPAWALNCSLIVLGVGCLGGGARFMVHGATRFAQYFGISDLVIGLTVVAIGTSLPELATSVVASLRRERDIAVGSVIGSNIFNLLIVLGISSLCSPTSIAIPPGVLRFDLPVMIAVAIACLPIFFTGYVISRWEGMVFLAYYGAYTTYLILRTTEHDGLSVFSTVLAFFVIPLTVITLVTIAWRSWRQGQ
jgi:cation:H+ antiporter